MLKTSREIKFQLIIAIFFGILPVPELAISANESAELDMEVSFSSSLSLFNEKELTWLANHQKIRIGTMDAWPPMDFVGNDGVAQGIGANFIKALNQRLQNRLEIVPGSWAKIYADVQQHRLDALMGITPRADREVDFNFTKPYVTVPHAIFANKDANNLNSLADLNGKKVGAERGFFIVKVLRDAYPGVEVQEYQSTSDALDALTKGDIDAYIGNRAVAMHIIESELIANIKQHGKITKTKSVNAIGVRKDWPVLRDILQKALDDIDQEERRKILAEWGAEDRTVSPGIHLSVSEKNWLKAHPVVKVAFDENYPPYSFRNKQGKIVGISVDYARELARRVGLSIEVSPEGKWNKLYAAAKKHEVDVIATLVKQDQRKEWFEFTRPYISLAQYIITKKHDMSQINRPERLAGKTVALIKDYSMTKVILDEVKGIKPYYVRNLDEALEAVSAGKADATIGAISMANHIITKESLGNLSFAFLYSKGQSMQRFGIRKDWHELASILNKAMQSLSDEQVISIFEHWTRPQVAAAEAELFEMVIELTDEERAWLNEHPVIRTASDPGWAPIEFVDEKGQYQGISIEYIDRLEQILGIKFERVKDQTWVEMVNNFKKGEIDLFTSVNRTPERESYINFTDSYTHFPIAIFSDPEMPFIIDMKELRGKKVGIVEGYATQELMETNYPQIELVMVADPVEALDLLSRGNIDAYVGNILVTGYYIGKLGYTHIKIVGKTPFQYVQSMGVRKDWTLFVSILNKALGSISETDKNAIYNQWIGVRYELGFDYALLWKILLAVTVVFIIFSYWNRKLSVLNKQLVVARSKEEEARKSVEQANQQLQAVDKLKSMFIASMSHELRTPLNSIIGFSGLLTQGVLGELTIKQKDSLQRINRAGNHLLGLISDVIDISKVEAGRLDAFPEKLLLKEVVDEAIESIRPLANAKSLALEVRADTWPELTTDRKRLMQCLLNYLSNAVKYSEQGKIILTVRVIDNSIEISVKDTGIGIDEKDIPRLFEAFERMDSHLRIEAGGAGLGLYLTKKIAEEILHGKVSVESQINEGSKFVLVIPVNALS